MKNILYKKKDKYFCQQSLDENNTTFFNTLDVILFRGKNVPIVIIG
jgi:hypothetical protein